MGSLEIKILENGHKRDTSVLQEIISNAGEDELANLVKSQLNSSNFSYIWTYMFQAFTDTASCHEKRVKVILTLLKELQEREVSMSQSTKLVQRVCMELMKFKTEHLVELCNFCLTSIQSNRPNSNTFFSWKDLLPDTLRVLVERDVVEFNELEYTGQEFKTNFINTLCMGQWNPSIITSLTAMFIDMPLTKEEHLKVVNKLASYIEKLTPQEVPPFVYQLLRLCRHQNSRAIFFKLQHYFNLRIYSNPNLTSNNSTESHDFDTIENADDHDVVDAESTVLFHIHNAASLGHNCIKDYLNSLKNAIKSPEFILHPFQLLSLFTISTISHYEETVFDIIRHSIVRCYVDQQKKASSYWYRETIITSCKPEEVFAQVINLGSQDKELLLQALVNFGFALLSVGSALGRDVIAEKQWNLGTMILLKIIKRKRHVASIILKTFCNHIVTRQSATQCIECLYILSKTLPLLMLENQSCIVELMDSLVQVPGNVANQLLDALIPLTKVSPTIRDHLILILRKALYSRSVETRQMAVNGFIKLMTTLKLSNMALLSHNSSGSFSSGHSLYTQISISRTTQTVGTSSFSNEAICWEILGILKRCFMQQAEVKSKLYEGLYDAVCTNPELGIPVLDVLWFHFVDYYVMDEESTPPLNFNKVSDMKELDSVLQEPLGKLIYAIALIVAKVQESDDERDNPTVVKYVQILESLSNRMANCELVHLELDDGTDLTDILPESQKKMHILKETLNVFEALIGYKISTWTSESENQARTINGLHQGYARFLHFGKNLSKPKKGKKHDGGQTQKDDGKPTQKNAKETQRQGNNTTRKIDPGLKSVSKPFKVPDTLLDFPTVEKGLKTLLEPSVPWTTTNEVNTIKTKTEIHKHFIQAAIFLVSKVKSHKPIDSEYQKSSYNNLTSVAATLYNRIVLRISDYVDFDCTSAVAGFECFHAILALINGQFRSNLVNFLSKVGGKDKEAEFIDHLKPLIEEFEKLFDADEEELSQDPEIKKLSLMVVNTLSVLCSLIPSDSNILSVQVYEWLKRYAYNNTVSSKVSGVFISLLCQTHIRYKVGLTLFEHISLSLKDSIGVMIDETVEENDDILKIVSYGTVNSIILSLCSNLKSVMDDIDTVIARIKSDYFILTYPGEDNINKKKEDLKTKEKAVSCQLCFVVTILTNLAKIAIPSGNLSEAIFKCIMQCYSSLSSLTKYFLSRSSKDNLAFQAARFEKIVKLAGKQLGPVVYSLILHIEGHQFRDSQSQVQKKKVEAATMKNKVLRETKIIPKVIYELEQFSKWVIQLTKKTKCDLSKYVGQGIVRDYRILKNKLDLGQEGEIAIQTAEAADEHRSDPETQSGVESNTENEDPASPPPTKKSKR